MNMSRSWQICMMDVPDAIGHYRCTAEAIALIYEVTQTMASQRKLQRRAKSLTEAAVGAVGHNMWWGRSRAIVQLRHF